MSAPRGGYRRPVKRSASKDADRASKRVAENNHNEHGNSERYKMVQGAALSDSATPRGPTGPQPGNGLKRLNPFSAEAERARKVVKVKEDPGTAVPALVEQTAPHSGAFGTFGKPSVFPSQPSAYREPTPSAFAPAHTAPRGGRDVGITHEALRSTTPERRSLPAELFQPTSTLAPAPRPETYAQQRISALPPRADGEAWIAVTPAEPGKAEWWPVEWYGARKLEGQAKHDYLSRAPPYGVFPDNTEPYWRQDMCGEWFVGPEDGKSWDLVKDASLLQQKIWMEQHGFKQNTQQVADTGVEPSQDSSLAVLHAQQTAVARSTYGEAEMMEQEEAQDPWSTWTSPSLPVDTNSGRLAEPPQSDVAEGARIITVRSPSNGAVSQSLPAQPGALEPVTPMEPAPAAVGKQEIVAERYRRELPKPLEFYKKHALAFQEYELKMGLKPGIMAAASKHCSAETIELQAMAAQLQASNAEKERLKAEKAQHCEQVAGYERKLEEQNAEWVGRMEKFHDQAKQRNKTQNEQKTDLVAEIAALKAALEIEKGKNTAVAVEETVGDHAEE
ncbi:hypothetical protein LTR56_011176 [Elasticomyces elasticus]|nr:hypothetical protein LTR56_011176 [Elasticomyces elasticus]KAK4921808.1 hypothetical protein LTR49_010746 [Elasticomyces elasticus]KAK5753416.1 hypothetical protein LTS12_016467 [Elasticomyces elasticus]